MKKEYKEYNVGDMIDIEYRDRTIKAKILNVNKINSTIELLLKDKKISLNAKNLGLEAVDLDENGIVLIKYK